MNELIRPAPLARRLAAAGYDLLLLIALWMLTAFAAVLVGQGEATPVASRAFQGVLLGIAWAFNAWFWTHGGQTLGMRAWRLQVRSPGGGPVGWLQASLRFAVAVPAWLLAGIGLLWCLVDPARRSWQDLASRTETVLLPPPGPDSDARKSQ